MLFSRQIGIDLGTANVLVFVRGQGIVINEPSVVAITTNDNRIQAVGDQASQMLGRTPGSIQVIRPMRSGVIADYVVTEAMLRYFIAKVCGRFRMWKPEVMVSVPCGRDERRAPGGDRRLRPAGGAREVYLIQEPLAAAIRANVPISYPSGNMIVNIGGGTTEVAVISLNGIVVSQSERVGGNRIDDAITAYIKRKYNLIIGDHMAEEIKIEVGSALLLDTALTVDVRGRDQVAGLPQDGDGDVHGDHRGHRRAGGADPGRGQERPGTYAPELSSDIIDKGMVMTGGTSLLRNLDQLLTNVTGIPCHVVELTARLRRPGNWPGPGESRRAKKDVGPAALIGP